MPYDPKYNEVTYQYRKNKLKRVPFDMQKPEYERLKAAAESAGETVNGYMRKAVYERMQREQSESDNNND